MGQRVVKGGQLGGGGGWRETRRGGEKVGLIKACVSKCKYFVDILCIRCYRVPSLLEINRNEMK